MPATTASQSTNLLQRFALRTAAILSAFVIAACQPGGGGSESTGPATGQMVDPDQPVRVALLVPGGAGNASIEYLARSMKNAARLAVGDAQGARIDLQIYDTGADTGKAVEQANIAANEGAKIIVGPLYAEAANAVGNAMAPHNINVLSLSNNTEIAGGNVFTLGTSFANVADRLVGYSVKQGKRNIYVVAEDDVAGQIGGSAIETAIAKNGGRLAGRTNHPVSVTGIDSAAPQIIQAAQSGRADALFMTANHQAVLPYMTEKLAAAGITPQVTQLMGLTRWDEPRSRLGMEQLQNGWFAIPDQRLAAQFSARYQSAYGEQPHELASLAYDGVSAIAAGLRAGNRNALTSAGLTRRSGFNGVAGVFRLRNDRTTERGLAVATIRNNGVVVLDPAPRGFGGFGS